MRRSGLPLSALITGAMVLLVGGTAAGVGWSGYQGAQKSVDALWRELADQIAQLTTARTRHLLEPAEPLANMSSQLVATGVLETEAPGPFLDYLTESAEAWPGFTWVYFGGEADGSLLAVARREGEAGLERHVRTQVGPARTRQVVMREGPDGWHTRSERFEHFDPRERPWYVAATSTADGGVWTDPYVFHGNGEPGVTYAHAVRDPAEGTLLGVFAVDFEMAPLSHMLSELRVATHGRAFVITRDGIVVGDPLGRLLSQEGEEPAFRGAADHPDPMLAGAFEAMGARADPWAPFEFQVPAGADHDGHMLGVATPFAPHTQIPWLVITVVPRDDLLGHAEQEAERAVLFALLALFAAVVGGGVLTWMIGSNVAQLRREILKVARFELFDESELHSSIRELHDMGQATLLMKTALRAFARYVPHQLVRQVLASGRDAQLGAERSELTVLFSDIEGFTSVVETVPPDEVLAALGAYLQELTAAINEHHGVVAQYVGDGIMAFWGAPEALEAHAVHACRGALAMRRQSARLAHEAAESGAPVFRTRIGIDTGEVMVGNIGAPDRFSYGILGDPVNTASRYEGLNKVFGTAVIAGERTVALARHAILFRPLDRVRPRGKRKPGLVYEVLGPHDEVSDEVLAMVAAYTAALEVYLAGRFSEARLAFEGVLEKAPDDLAATLMVQRCTVLEAHPPGKSWTGVFEASSEGPS